MFNDSTIDGGLDGYCDGRSDNLQLRPNWQSVPPHAENTRSIAFQPIRILINIVLP